jgi:phosphatidylinositol kinase/protein kinase (PI-3  family)
MEQTFEREMTISHSDFFRILPKALKSYLYQQHENLINVTLDEGEIVIILSEERLRKIASLSLPVTDVTFRVKNVAENTKNEFFKKFDRAYQRGGG